MPAGATIKELTAQRKEGRLVGLRCGGCKKVWTTPVARCASCGGTGLERVELPPEGTVVTFTVQNVASEEFMNEVPYAWVIVKLRDGTNVTGWVPYIASDRDLKIGDRVKYTPGYKPGVMFEKA